MRTLSAASVIEVWERGLGQAPVERALTLLAACADDPAENLPALSVGQRDARLTEVYRRLFGETLEAYAECPQCGERLEYSIPARELQGAAAGEGNAALKLMSGGATLQLRLPNSLDLMAAGRCGSVDEAREMLARRCIVSQGLPDGLLPDGLIEEIAERLRTAEPEAEQLIQLTCIECSHRWQLVLDIERFLWMKLGVLAKRLLREVHVLARAYGWSEAEILAMAAVRRQLYIEMVGA